MSGDRLLGPLNQRADISRITANVYDDPPVASTPITFTRADGFYAEAVLSGFSDGTGGVTIIGTNSAGLSISTVLTFTGNQRRHDVQDKFFSITYVNTSGLTNESMVGTVQINAVSRTGQPDEQFTTFRLNVPVRFSGLREDEIIAFTGGKDVITGKCFIGTYGDVKRRDKLLFRGQSYNIRAIRPVYNRESLRDHRVMLISAEDQL